jgi:hypothetical protein
VSGTVTHAAPGGPKITATDYAATHVVSLTASDVGADASGAAAAAQAAAIAAIPALGTTTAAVGTSAGGAATTTSKSDHVHATGAGTPSTQAFGDAASTGSGPAAAMTDHKHGMPANPVAYAAPSLTLSTSNSAGSAGSAVRTDATIAAFDATVPVTQASGDAAATGSAGVAARRDHVHGMPTIFSQAQVLARGLGA